MYIEAVAAAAAVYGSFSGFGKKGVASVYIQAVYTAVLYIPLIYIYVYSRISNASARRRACATSCEPDLCNISREESN